MSEWIASIPPSAVVVLAPIGWVVFWLLVSRRSDAPDWTPDNPADGELKDRAGW